MQLILHAGPMKTGSTALQNAIEFAQSNLARRGLLARRSWIADAIVQAEREAEQAEWIATLLREAQEQECERILISNEFLASFHDTTRLGWIRQLVDSGHSVRALLVRRPLVELYPSLYLQNLKGPAKRTTSFRRFVEEQRAIDTELCWHRDGTTFNYRCLRRRLEGTGARVEEVSYSRSSLIHDVFSAVWPGLCPDVQDLSPSADWLEETRDRLRAEGRIDHSRSLSFELAPAAIAVNELCIQGTLSDSQRNQLLVSLLDASAGSPQVPGSDRPLLAEIAELDAQLHGALVH